ncbi:hypothetical protein ACWGR4_01655 [Embleya sp. NPDC055664]
MDQSGQAAVAAYRGMWDAVVRAKATSDAQSPELRRFASGQALQYFVLTTQDDREHGLVAKGDVKISPRVISTSPTRVSITDCVDASAWLRHRVVDGQLKDDTPGGHHKGEASVVLTDGRWLVEQLTLGGVGTC